MRKPYIQINIKSEPAAQELRRTGHDLVRKCTAGLLALSFLAYSVALTTAPTAAALSDMEDIIGNTVTAAKLDFTLTAGAFTPAGGEDNLFPGQSITRDVTVVAPDSILFDYSIASQKTGGDDDFCNVLQLTSRLEGVQVYSGSLLGFTSGPLSFGGLTDDWQFTITLPSGASSALQGQLCQFSLVYDANQPGFTPPAGFFDSEAVDSDVTAGTPDDPAQDEISPIQDAYVSESQADTNFGTTNDLRILAGNTVNQRSFIKFDFHFPSGTQINSAKLKLFNFNPSSVNRSYELRKVDGAWNESTITWNTQPSASGAPTDSAASQGGWMQWDVLPDVNNFVAGNANNGWRLNDSQEGTPLTYLSRFRSNNHSNPLTRPVLDINFTPPVVNPGHVVINEVYYNVDPNRGADPSNEWIELYNPTDSDVDVSGWKICDAASCDTLPTTPAIPSKGFAVITNNNLSTWPNWPELHPSALLIQINSNIGGGLNDAGDAVRLRDASDALVDQISYGNNTSVFNPSTIPSSGIGRSIARIVKGFDTDEYTDWVVNATPNPGTNPSESGAEVMRFTSEGIMVADSAVGLPLLAGEMEKEEIIPSISEEAPKTVEATTPSGIEGSDTTTSSDEAPVEEVPENIENTEESTAVDAEQSAPKEESLPETADSSDVELDETTPFVEKEVVIMPEEIIASEIGITDEEQQAAVHAPEVDVVVPVEVPAEPVVTEKPATPTDEPITSTDEVLTDDQKTENPIDQMADVMIQAPVAPITVPEPEVIDKPKEEEVTSDDQVDSSEEVSEEVAPPQETVISQEAEIEEEIIKEPIIETPPAEVVEPSTPPATEVITDGGSHE